MNAQTRAEIRFFRSEIRILTRSRNKHPQDLKRVRIHNKAIKAAEKLIEKLEKL